MRIITITNTDERFYNLIGPFLSRREITKELGSPVWDDDGKTWIVALDGQRVLGFCAYTKPNQNGVVTFCSAFVIPSARANGVYKELSAHRLALTQQYRRVAIATRSSVKTLKTFGFKVVSEKGKFFRVERDSDK